MGKAEGRSVEFHTSRKVVTWKGGSLLELAEQNGIPAPFSCRTGSCGACRTPIVSGRVEYPRRPSFPVADGEVLLCSARPLASDQEPLVVEL